MSELMIDYVKDGHKITVEKSNKHVSARIGEEVIASTGSALILREDGYKPVYYIPIDDVRKGILVETAKRTTCQFKGHAMYYTIKLGEQDYKDSVWRYLDTYPEFDGIRDYVAFYSNVADVSELSGE